MRTARSRRPGPAPDGDHDTGERKVRSTPSALRLWYSDGLTNPLARGTTYGPAPLNCQDYAAYYPPGVDPCETGNQARNRIIDTYVAPALDIPRTSQNVQTLAIFNSFTYGGIGGAGDDLRWLAAGSLISLHELGHSLGTMADEYPYSARDVVRPATAVVSPAASTTSTPPPTDDRRSAQVVAVDRRESLSGGTLGLRGGGTFPCGQRRPSEHSIMRWLGFDWDQVGREHMVARITGRRNASQMALSSIPEGTVPRDGVLWVETQHPKSHQLDVTWRIGGPDGEVVDTGNSATSTWNH
jgi:hypothetical protein